MNIHKNTAYFLAFTFVSAVSFIYLFIAIALVPYWQELSGPEIQSWWAGPFTWFSNIMIPLHLLSIITIIYAFIVNGKGSKDKFLWLMALITLLVCQGFNMGLHGPVYNPELQSGVLEAKVALATFDDWDFYHTVRTIAVIISMTSLLLIGIRQNAAVKAN